MELPGYHDSEMGSSQLAQLSNKADALKEVSRGNGKGHKRASRNDKLDRPYRNFRAS